MTRSHPINGFFLATAAAAALLAAPPAFGQRASLGERVAALEARAADNQGNIDLLNQVTALREELRALRGQVEELQQQNRTLETTVRNQYLDVDDRLNTLEGGRLEGGALEGGTPAARAGATVPPTNADAGTTGTSAAPPGDSAPIVFGDAGLLANAADERGAYETAFAALRAGDYPGAAGLFEEFLRLYPTGSYAPNATYWLGESRYVTQDYAGAQSRFEAILERWPTHDKAPGALLKVGLSQYGQRDLAAAEATLEQVAERYPGTDAARTAEDRLRSIRLNSLR